MAERGYRGYIGCRPIGAHRVPQHVQNLVIRDYAQRKGLAYRLSAAEYVMPGSYLMLEQVLGDLDSLDGLIVYSLFMLPDDARHRATIWRRVLDAGASLHAAVEDQVLANKDDIERLETLFLVNRALAYAWRPDATASMIP
ncbi:MAG: LIC12192 family sporadic carbohydrate cluster protein [Acidobacteriota bacterium]